ncbi:hypothetical protein M758_10G167400 [Ceratodon purpureus]|nr:hypothetical protein M758_10G167400 [Ceratodon purpureus]
MQLIIRLLVERFPMSGHRLPWRRNQLQQKVPLHTLLKLLAELLHLALSIWVRLLRIGERKSPVRELQVEAILSSDEVKGDPVGPIPITTSLQQIIMAISYLAKGFGDHLAANGRPIIGNMFKQTLDVVLRVIPVFPKNKILRSKVISFLHQMVGTLGSAVFPALPTIIQQLLTDCEPKDLVEFIQLINQLINKFKIGMMDILQEIFPSIVGRVFALLPQDGIPEGPGSLTEELRELLDLQRNYFLLLHAMTTQELSAVMLTQQSSRLLQNIIPL